MNSLFGILKKYGFTESEVKVYITLLKNKPLSGYETAKKSGVSRSKVYDVLENLINKGIVMKNMSEGSTLYKAESYKKITSFIREDVINDVDNLENMFEGYNSSIEDELIWSLKDYSLIKYKVLELIDRAKKNVYLQIWKEELIDETEQAIILKENQGVKVVVVLYDQNKEYNTKLKNVYVHGYEKEKIEEFTDRWINISIDNEEIFYASIKSKEIITGLYTKNKSMVFFATEYIMHDIYCLKLIKYLRKVDKSNGEKYINEIRRIFENEHNDSISIDSNS